MKMKEFLKPSKEIALILILTPLVMLLLTYALGPLYSFANSIEIMILINSILSPIIPSIFIAAAFLLKFKKELSYYLTFYLPATLFEIAVTIISGAFPIMQLSVSPASIWPVILMLLSTLAANFIFAPLFLLWLPRKMAKFGRSLSAFFVGFLYLIFAQYVMQVVTGLLMNGSYNYTIQNIEIISDVIYVVLIVVYSALLFGKFKNLLRKKR
jgi:hypothetical protein